MKKKLKVILCVLVVYALAEIIGFVHAIEIDTSGTELEIDTYKAQGHRSSLWDEDVFKGFQEYYHRNFNNAIEPLKKAYELGCRDGLVLYRLAISYTQLGDFKEAANYAEEALLHLKKNYPNHYYNETIGQLLGKSFNEVGKVYYNKRDYQKAIEFFKKALHYRDTIDRGVDAWWLAISYEALKDYEQAAKYWKLAAQIYGKDSEWGRKALNRLNQIK